MTKPTWWPRNPYPEDIFPMQRKDYAEVVPDPLTRTRISGMLGREFWEIASEGIWNAWQDELTEIRDAVHWLWGFWDGNTLVPYTNDSALQEEIQAAFEECLRAVEVHTCADCGNELQAVRPGKWQCPECE